MINDPFAGRLRNLVAASGLPLASVADQAGLSHMTLHRYLSGDQLPSMHDTARLAKVLDPSGKGSLTIFDGAV